MRLTLLFAALFFIAAIVNFTDGDNSNAIAGLFISGLMVGIFFYFRKEERQSLDFLKWVANNREVLSRSGAMYAGTLITQKTELTRFQACLSFLILTVKSPSRYFIKDKDGILKIGLVYSFVTLLFGWWGIPWGPIYTVQSLIKNFTGGYKQTIADILLEMDKVATTSANTAQTS